MKKTEDDFPPIIVHIEPGNAPAELITDYYVALSALYRAYGGSGLKIEEDKE